MGDKFHKRMNRYSRNKTSEVQVIESTISQRNKIVKDFEILSKVLLAAGLTFPSLKGRKMNNFCPKLFEIIVNIMAIFVIFVNIFFWQRRYSSVTLHLTTSLTISLALSVRFVLLLYRRQIPKMIRNLILLYEDITYKKIHKSFKKPIVIGCFITLLLMIMASVLECHRIQVDENKGEHSIQFLIKLNDTDGRYQKWMFHLIICLVPIKMYFAYGVSVMILIFCCSVYTAAKRIIVSFHDHIKQSNREDTVPLTNSMISSYLNYYNRISQSVAEIDNVLSPCVLLLYGLMVSGQFYTLTVLISKDTEPTSLTTVLQNITVFLLTSAAFLVVTLCASKVTEVFEDAKRSLQKLSEKISSSDEKVFGGSNISNTYLILISILSGSHLSFTGWKMFNINRSFILTTMGVMISYGVIVVQIGRKYGGT